MKCFALTALGFFIVIEGGCAATTTRAHDPIAPLSIPNGHASPRVTVCGSLLRMLPTVKMASALESFLVGPSRGDPPIVRNPQGMALLDQELLVCDQGRAHVLALNLSSGAVRFWTDADHPPATPVDIAADPNGVYVVDGKRERVLIYDQLGKYAGELPSPSDSFRPACVACDDGVVFVGDVARGTVERWSIDERRWLSPIAPPAGSPPLAAPTGLAVGQEGTILICDTLGGRVHVVTPKGDTWRTIGKPGRGAAELVRPKQVAVTRGGLIAVADAGRQSVQVYRSDGRHLFEICERSESKWRGLTLPVGVIAGIPLAAHAPDQLSDAVDWLIIADAMGDPVLTAVAVFAE